MKVYCKDCKFLRTYGTAYRGMGFNCVHPSNIKGENSAVTEHHSYKQTNEEKNRDNNCKFFSKSSLLRKLLNGLL